MISKSQAIKRFLDLKAPPDLAELYGLQMECQVNVAQGSGEVVEGEFKGRKWRGYSDGIQTWKPIRIPMKANTPEPEFNDSEIKWDIAAHAEAIGMTGWDWQAKRSRWVAYDFDAIAGHSERHDKKLSTEQLQEVQKLACQIPWVSVRRSTSGNGLHLYVVLTDSPAFKTETHTEHAAMARAILGKMSALTGFDFSSKVDACGGNLWVWHRKYEAVGGRNGPGLALIKKGETLAEPPPNWREHIKVTSGAKRRVAPGFVGEQVADAFEELCGQNHRIPLDEDHKKLIDFLEKSKAMWWFDQDHHMLVCHTQDLAKAHKELGLKGIFRTASSGSSEINCFAYPMRKGAWSVRRYTQGVGEADTWEQDQAGWTRCYFNKPPDLKTAARSNGGTENEDRGFEFPSMSAALATIRNLGGNVDVPDGMSDRKTLLKPHKDGRLIVQITRNEGDQPMAGWSDKKRGIWSKVLDIRAAGDGEPEVANHDDVIRHLLSDADGVDCGWVVRVDNQWAEEPLQHIRLALAAMGRNDNEIKWITGGSVMRPWRIVSRPFEPEFPGDRRWNRNAAKFAVPPNPDLDSLQYPHWKKILDHLGKNLDKAVLKDDWCKTHSIKTGSDYLKLWLAAMIQFPMEPLPLLFFYGPQDCGKSILWEGLRYIIDPGIKRVENALTSQQNFNAEIEGAVLGVIEELDLRSNKTTAYNRIKDYVTSRRIPIHRKNFTPYDIVNTLHLMHFANDVAYAVVLPGDKRLVYVQVDSLLKADQIPKGELEQHLQKQAPDFLATLLATDIPPTNSRLRIPPLETEEKDQAARETMNEVELFCAENGHYVEGAHVLLSDWFERFNAWLDPDLRTTWGKGKAGREIPKHFPKGRLRNQGAPVAIGNFAWEPREEPLGPAFVLNTEKGTIDNPRAT